MSYLNYLAAGLLVFVSACSTTAKVLGSAELPNLSPTSFGVVIPYHLNTSGVVVGEEGCVLSLQKKSQFKSYDLHFQPGRDILFAELPEGTYRYKQIFCGSNHWDLLGSTWVGFQVFPHSLSLVGGISIELMSSHRMNIRIDRRTDDRDEALRLFGRLPTAELDRVVSAYTGKAIPREKIEKPARWKDWELKDETGKIVKVEKKDWPSFHSCYQGEKNVNALWLGNLEFQATYEKGELVKLENTEVWNSLTDHFSDCAKETLKAYRPKESAHLTYTLYL